MSQFSVGAVIVIIPANLDESHSPAASETSWLRPRSPRTSSPSAADGRRPPVSQAFRRGDSGYHPSADCSATLPASPAACRGSATRSRGRCSRRRSRDGSCRILLPWSPQRFFCVVKRLSWQSDLHRRCGRRICPLPPVAWLRLSRLQPALHRSGRMLP